MPNPTGQAIPGGPDELDVIAEDGTVLLRLWDGKELLSVDQMNPIQARKAALAFVRTSR